jgi:hypothetical protein
MNHRTLRRMLLLGAVLVAGCYSPTLPLPPPLKPEITVSETGAYHLQGSVMPDAQVSALNERSLDIDGQQANHTGAYSFDLKDGHPGDVIELWYRYANDLSSAVAFDLPDLSERGAAGGAGGMGSSAAGASGTAAAGAAGAGN